MIKLYYLKKLLFQLFGLPLYAISFFTIRNKNTMIFGEWLGKGYCDNSKYLFEYSSKYAVNKKVVWITKRKKIEKIIKGKGMSCEYAYSLKGIFYCLTARYVFCTHGSADVNQYFLGRAILINLTHGTPLKRIGRDAQYERLGKLTFLYDNYISFLLPENKKFNYIFCADDVAKERFSSAYNYPVEILPFGYPRWAGLVKEEYALGDRVQSYKKVISYLPTLRFNNHIQLNPFEFPGFDDFLEYIQMNDYLLIVRPHPAMTYLTSVVGSKNVIFINNEVVDDVNQVLQVTDVLISDYSSVIYDFEKTGRQILLLAPDAESYINNDVGVYGDYFKDFTYPIVTKWSELPSFINEECASKPLLDDVLLSPASRIINYVNAIS